METGAQTCARLTVALEDLLAQESASLSVNDFGAVIALQERASPLVDHLVAHGPAVADQGLRARIAALLFRRAETGERLAVKMAQTRQEMDLTQVAQRRVARVAPVYGQSSVPVTGQLLAVG